MYPAREGFPHRMPVMDMAPDGTAYVATPTGEYETVLGDGVRTAVDMIDWAFAEETAALMDFNSLWMSGSMDYVDAEFASMWNAYGELGFETTGGVWDLNELRVAPNPRTGMDVAASFSSAFIEFLKRDVEEKLAIDVIATSPDVAFDVLSGHYSDGVMTYDVQFAGDGHAHGFDLQFVNANNDILTYQLVNDLPAGRPVPGMKIDHLTGEITWTPDEFDIRETPHEVEIRVSDGHGGVATTLLSVTVVEPDEDHNLPPEIISVAATRCPPWGSSSTR